MSEIKDIMQEICEQCIYLDRCDHTNCKLYSTIEKLVKHERLTAAWTTRKYSMVITCTHCGEDYIYMMDRAIGSIVLIAEEEWWEVRNEADNYRNNHIRFNSNDYGIGA